MPVDLSRARRCPVWRYGVGPDDLHKCFPNVLVRGNTQECWLLVCILVVSKAHVCASLSSHPLCVSALPSARGSPLQSSRFLPSPSQPTTQQVERWSPRALLWPGGRRPGLRMMDSAQAPSARGQELRLSPLLSCELLLLHCCGVCTDVGARAAGTPSSSQQQGWEHAPCPPAQAWVVSWSHQAIMPPGRPLGRFRAPCGLSMQ